MELEIIKKEEDPEIIVQMIVELNRKIDDPKTATKERQEFLEKRRRLTRRHTFLTSGFPPIGSD